MKGNRGTACAPFKSIAVFKLIKATQLQQLRAASPKKSFQGIYDQKWAISIELGRGRTWFKRLYKFTSPQAKDLQMEIVWDCGSMDLKLELEYLNISAGHCLCLNKIKVYSISTRTSSLPATVWSAYTLLSLKNLDIVYRHTDVPGCGSDPPLRETVVSPRPPSSFRTWTPHRRTPGKSGASFQCVNVTGSGGIGR